MTDQTILDLDAILDSTMDSVPDVPDFVNPPDGNYTLDVFDAKIEQFEKKDDKTKTNVIILQYAVAKTIETKEVPVPDGSMFTERFQATEDGLKYFKKRAKGILDTDNIDGVSIRDILSELKAKQFDAQLKTKKSTKDGKEYENINVRPLTKEGAKQEAIDAK